MGFKELQPKTKQILIVAVTSITVVLIAAAASTGTMADLFTFLGSLIPGN